MQNINFQPVFDYIDHSKEELKEEILTEFNGKLSNINTSIANLATEVRDLKEEVSISNHRLDRAENWIDTAAKKIRVPFGR